MKKLIYLLAGVALTGCLAACDDDKDNPGDFSLKSELELGDITTALGHYYPLVVDETKDTVYEYFYTAYDTIYNELGEVQFDEFGDTLVEKRKASYFSKKTAKLIRMKPVELFPEADTITIPVRTNALWQAPKPIFSIVQADGEVKILDDFMKNEQSTLAGGGNSRIILSVAVNSRMRSYGGVQTIFTRDSLTMYKIPFKQAARGKVPEGYDYSLEPGYTPDN